MSQGPVCCHNRACDSQSLLRTLSHSLCRLLRGTRPTAHQQQLPDHRSQSHRDTRTTPLNAASQPLCNTHTKPLPTKPCRSRQRMPHLHCHTTAHTNTQKPTKLLILSTTQRHTCFTTLSGTTCNHTYTHNPLAETNANLPQATAQVSMTH